MGSLMVRSDSGMSTVGKVAVGVVVCYVALQVLPLILGASVIVGVFGLAAITLLVSLITTLLSAAVYIGVPILFIAFLVSVFAGDD